MQYKDHLDLDYTAGSQHSIDEFGTFTDKYLASRSDVLPFLDNLLNEDNDIPMAHCLRGYILKMAGDPGLSTAVQGSISTLNRLEKAMNKRELMHRDALEKWAGNRFQEAARVLESLLSQYPMDVLALRLVHYLHFYAGDAAELRDSVSRSLSAWKPADPFYGYVLGMHSFGLEEAGDYEAAEEAGRQAVEINPMDIWAAHAVAHVFQMQQRSTEGIRWIENLIDYWQEANNFIFHLHWHKALFHLGCGEPEAALTIYDEHLTDCLADDFYLDVCNGAALLWRLQMHGVDVGDRWEPIADVSRPRILDDELVFSTLHYLMAPAVLRDDSTTSRALEHFEHWSSLDTTQGEVCRYPGSLLARSIVDLGTGHYEEAVRNLEAVKKDLYRIGGSHAQRHLFDELLEYYGSLSGQRS